MCFEIKPIDTAQMTWVVKADGIVIHPKLLEIDSDYGSFKLGLRPEGFHGWAFKPSKGGAMTIPWCKSPNNGLLVGLVHEHRPNFGTKKVWCPLGGFIEPGESAKKAQERESMEEGGIDTSVAQSVPGQRINTDRMYYIMEDGDDWGMKLYSFEVPYHSLESDTSGHWRIKQGLISHKKESELFFLSWKDAVYLSEDALALAGIARLMRTLL